MYDVRLVTLFERFENRGIIAHRGFPDQWLTELLKQPGGGGYFRLDLRLISASGRQTPLEWLTRTHLLPIGIPVPFFIKIRSKNIWIRHLLNNEFIIHPTELYWLTEEIENRYHACLQVTDGHLSTTLGLAHQDNQILSFFNAIDD